MPSTKLIGQGADEIEVNAPIVFRDVLYHDLSSDYTAPGKEHRHGVFFKGDTDGKYRAVTLQQYYANGGDQYMAQSGGPTDVERDAVIAAAVAASDYVDLYLAAYQWSDVAVMFIESTDAAGTNINIGLY